METLQQYVTRLNEEVEAVSAKLATIWQKENRGEWRLGSRERTDALQLMTPLSRRLRELKRMLKTKHLNEWQASRRRSVLASLLARATARKPGAKTEKILI